MTLPPQPESVTSPGSPEGRGVEGVTRRPRRTVPPPPFPPGSREAQVWRALAYRGQVPTLEAVNQEVRRPAVPSAQPNRPLRRSAVVGRLANQGPAVAGYIASYWATHRVAPTWVDIARALHWPGDAIDHERALTALAGAGWIRGNGTDPTYPGPRWAERNAPVAPPPDAAGQQP